jgi:uncharacterized OB-fold protein
MEQQAVVELAEEALAEELKDVLVVCKSCSHLVPKTMVCLYCGAPILFKRPRSPGP